MPSKKFRASAVLTALAFILGACGSDSGGDAGSAATDAGASETTAAAAAETTAAAAAGGEATGEVPDLSAYTIGFAQVGAESGWRTANTKSIQESE